MKKILITLLIFCSLLITGCSSNIFESTSYNAIVLAAASIEDYNTAYNLGLYTINKNGTCEYSITYDWQKVETIDAVYSDFDVQIRKKLICYGTYIQNENEFLITLDEKTHYFTYEIQGKDSDAFKAVYTLNNINEGNVFSEKVETEEGFTALTFSTTAITAKLSENILKLSSIKNYYNGDCVEQVDFSYLSDGKTKNINYRNKVQNITYDYDYNDDGTYTVTSLYYYDTSKAPKQIIVKNTDGSTKSTLYDENGKIYCIVKSENGNTDIKKFKGTMRLYSYNDDNSYTVTVYKDSLLSKSKSILQKEEYTADNVLTKTIKYNNGKPSEEIMH